jgi:hypothetical protein
MQVRSLVLSSLVATLAAGLTACGGGGGSSGGGTPPDVPAPPAATGVAGLVPGATMTWDTAADRTLTVNVLGLDGHPASGAAVRVFSLSRTSPQDGAPLAQPVPVSLIEASSTDAAGNAAISLRMPAHLTEVLVVSTLGDAQAQGAVATDGPSAQLALTLAR